MRENWAEKTPFPFLSSTCHAGHRRYRRISSTLVTLVWYWMQTNPACDQALCLGKGEKIARREKGFFSPHLKTETNPAYLSLNLKKSGSQSSIHAAYVRETKSEQFLLGLTDSWRSDRSSLLRSDDGFISQKFQLIDFCNFFSQLIFFN